MAWIEKNGFKDYIIFESHGYKCTIDILSLQELTLPKEVKASMKFLTPLLTRELHYKILWSNLQKQWTIVLRKKERMILIQDIKVLW